MRSFYFLFIFIIVLILSPFFLFTVYETDRALIEYLGKLETDSKTHAAKIYNPGLHFRIPGLQVVRTFDMRLKVLDLNVVELQQKKKKMC